jgi:uncharacterized protein YfaT (DUF1175 family)
MSVPLLYIAALAIATHDARWLREEGTNDGKAVRRVLKNAGINVAAPWCAAWVQDISDSAAKSLGMSNPLDEVKQEALVQSYANWASAKPKDRLVIFPSRALPGDLVLFKFGTADRWNHIGIVTHPPHDDATGAAFRTIEANTSSGAAGSQRDGDGVYERIRTVVPGKTMFVRWAP